MESGVAGNNIEPKRRRGALIVVEGLDRAGKSTQCAMLMDMLEGQGYMAEYIRFPGCTCSVFI